MVQDIWLPPATDVESERRWLAGALLAWLDREFLAEAIHPHIAERAASIYARQRMEGEDLLASIHVVLLAEMRHDDYAMTACSEFVVANAVAELLIARLEGKS
ncbi:hypothetical protein [Gloeobacter morelensis]|uniref:Uncharacterized protein n=1 Tax=Gloeobacter morelensis MG652769 TaxID=2781736 RepID=A0ABY3PKT2_9CYAN|nr:hypothetical protein [Gloeobacter morelensis]UFP94197.1 hypothetical protein ISF26_20945 [Gloeobacter morelensis MG652769]